MTHLHNDIPLRDAVEDIRHYIAEIKAERGLPGCSVAIVQGNSVLWAEGFGLADHSLGIPCSPRTVYKIASLTKLFTASLLMIYREEGLLNLDDQLSKFLHTVRVVNPFTDPRPLTFRQIASHTAGLPCDVEKGAKAARPETKAKEFLRWLRDTSLVSAPLSCYRYSNVGYAVLGHVLSVLGEKPFKRALTHKVLNHLGMKSTAFDVKQIEKDKLAIGYLGPASGKTLRVAEHTGSVLYAPAGGLYSSVLDLARFLSWQFHDGSCTSDRPLGIYALREMHSPVVIENDWSGGSAIGWRIGRIAHHSFIGHMGGLPGYSSEIMAIPALKLGIVALTNMEATVGGICWNSLNRLMPIFDERQNAGDEQ